MMDRSRRRAASATFLGMGATVAITVAQAFLLVPLCLKHLGAQLYGSWLGAFDLLIWVQFFDCGVPNLMTQRIAASLSRSDAAGAARWVTTGMTLLVLIALALCAIGAGIATPLSRWMDVPADQVGVFVASFRLAIVASALLLIFNGCLGLSRGVQRTGTVNVAQVAGVLANLIVSVWLLIRGWGLWALSTGLLVRALLSLAGGLLFAWNLPRELGGPLVRPSRAVAGDVAVLMPSMTSASAGYLLANNSEVFLVATLFGPTSATVYALTRRAFDGLRNLLDSFAWAVYGGFSHLVAAADRHRARLVLHEVLWLRVAAGCLCGAVAIAVNQAFVDLLFGREHFGGLGLTVAFALQMVIGGQAFLANFLLRAAGEVREGSLWLAADATVRVMAMIGGLELVGLSGAPWAAVLVSGVTWLVMLHRLDRTLPLSDLDVDAGRPVRQAMPLAVLAVGVIGATMWPPSSWAAIVLAGTAVGILGGLALWLMMPASSDRGVLPRWLSSPAGRW